jgi:hypothetical protein
MGDRFDSVTPPLTSFLVSPVIEEIKRRREMIFFSAADGFSLANCANPSGDRFALFKNPSNFLSYGSLVAGLLIAAENNSKLSP